ncbi:hypothetical protein HJFPF1_10849 [Paramyrothecium foliicola]|nr:hypothetical protein HJFPF1_10849 [Paramyrothecium foliicola]
MTHNGSELAPLEATEQQAPTSYTIAEDISAFNISPAEFLASRPDIHNLMAGAIVLRLTPSDTPEEKVLEMLLLQRAPSDSFPLQWEIPGGTADPSSDTSIAGVAVRELWEETQLRAHGLSFTVGLGLPTGVTSLTLVGEAEDARMDNDLELCLLRVGGLTWAVVTFIADVEIGNTEVVLRPDEHIAWAWVTEDEARNGLFRGGAGRRLDFVSEAMRLLVLEGFRRRKDMV